VLVDQHKNQIYESLIERVDKLVKDWRARIGENKDISDQLTSAEEILTEINDVQKKKAEFNLSDEEMSAWLVIKNQLSIKENDEDLLKQIRELFDELDKLKIPGWTKNTELRKSVETKLRQFLFVNVKPKYPMDLEKINSIHKSIREQLTGYEG